MATDLRHIDDLLPEVLDNIDRRPAPAEWDLVKRNLAITARNRNMKLIREMIGGEYREKELEQPEEFA